MKLRSTKSGSRAESAVLLNSYILTNMPEIIILHVLGVDVMNADVHV